MTSTLLNLRFIKKQKPVVLFEKVLYANKLKVKKVSLNVPELLYSAELEKSFCDFENSL